MRIEPRMHPKSRYESVRLWLFGCIWAQFLRKTWFFFFIFLMPGPLNSDPGHRKKQKDVSDRPETEVDPCRRVNDGTSHRHGSRSVSGAIRSYFLLPSGPGPEWGPGGTKNTSPDTIYVQFTLLAAVNWTRIVSEGVIFSAPRSQKEVSGRRTLLAYFV